MQEIRIETVVEEDREVYLLGLPCHRGDKFEVTLRIWKAADCEQERGGSSEAISRPRRGFVVLFARTVPEQRRTP